MAPFFFSFSYYTFVLFCALRFRSLREINLQCYGDNVPFLLFTEGKKFYKSVELGVLLQDFITE